VRLATRDLSDTEGSGSNPERVLIPNEILRSALDEELAVLGPLFKDIVLENLTRGGIDLRGTELKYSLLDIRMRLTLLFGSDPTETIMDRMRTRMKGDI